MLRILVSSVCVLFLSFHSYNVLANQQTLDKCRELLNNKIQEDITSSFPLIKDLKKKDNTLIFKYNDLIKMVIPIGKEDTHLNSLIKFFHGTSIGERQLLITTDRYNRKSDNNFTGYVYYKELNGTNVLLKLKRGTKRWEVVQKSKIRGKYITLAQINKDCLRNH